MVMKIDPIYAAQGKLFLYDIDHVLTNTRINQITARRILPLLHNAIRGRTASSCRLTWIDDDLGRSSLEIIATENDPWPTLRFHGRHLFKPTAQEMTAFVHALRTVGRTRGGRL